MMAGRRGAIPVEMVGLRRGAVVIDGMRRLLPGRSVNDTALHGSGAHRSRLGGVQIAEQPGELGDEIVIGCRLRLVVIERHFREVEVVGERDRMLPHVDRVDVRHGLHV